MSLVAGVDLGGTNIAVALVDAEHRVEARARVATPAGGPQEVLDAIVTALAGLPDAPASVGVGAPGPVSDGVVLTAPNLGGWDGAVPLAERLGERLGVAVVVENDATAGVVGEWVAGAGRGVDHLLGVWLGTGVGGGLVLDGRPYRGASGAAGEFGHITARPGGRECGCGARGCVEAYAGRGALEDRVAEAVAAGEPTALEDLRRSKGKDRYTSGVWAKARRQGDALATRLLDEAVTVVGEALASTANLLDLERVVLGGGLAEKLGDELAHEVAAAARPHLLVPERAPQVVVAELGDDAGVVGAAALARG